MPHSAEVEVFNIQHRKDRSDKYEKSKNKNKHKSND